MEMLVLSGSCVHVMVLLRGLRSSAVLVSFRQKQELLNPLGIINPDALCCTRPKQKSSC